MKRIFNIKPKQIGRLPFPHAIYEFSGSRFVIISEGVSIFIGSPRGWMQNFYRYCNSMTVPNCYLQALDTLEKTTYNIEIGNIQIQSTPKRILFSCGKWALGFITDSKDFYCNDMIGEKIGVALEEGAWRSLE